MCHLNNQKTSSNIIKPRVKSQAVKNKGDHRKVQKFGIALQRMIVDRNFIHREANSGVISHLVGFFYKCKFSYMEIFHSKELRNYRITIVFLFKF